MARLASVALCVCVFFCLHPLQQQAVAPGVHVKSTVAWPLEADTEMALAILGLPASE